MASLTNYLLDAGHAVVQYASSNQVLAYQKDGKQELAVGLLTIERWGLLYSQITHVFPRLYYLPVTPLLVGMNVSSTLSRLYDFEQLSGSFSGNSCGAKLGKEICLGIKKFGPRSAEILKHADNILNGACLVSYVAFIAFGSPVTGALGLAMLSLLALKRRLLLPSFIDRVLTSVDGGARAVVHSMASTSILFKLVYVTSALSSFSASISPLIKRCSQYFPSLRSLVHPFHDLHQEGNLPLTWAEVESQLAKKSSIVRSHVFANEIEDIFPLDQDRQVKGSEELFAELEAAIKQKNFTFADSQQKENFDQGLEMIKKLTIDGRVQDVLPTNPELFQETMRQLIAAILKDPDFEAKVKELAEIGHACAEGFTREVTFMLHSQSKNIRWAVHHQLAILRGELVKETFRAMAKDLNKIAKEENLLLKEQDLFNQFGGVNNTHVLNGVQSMLWHHLRTYEAELYTQMRPRGFLGNFFMRYVAAGEVTFEEMKDKIALLKSKIGPIFLSEMHWLRKISLVAKEVFQSGLIAVGLDFPYMVTQLAQVHPALNNPQLAYGFTFIALSKLKEGYFGDSKRIAQYVSDALVPDYEDGRPVRKIEWEAVTSWIADMGRRYPKVNIWGLFVITKQDMIGEDYSTLSEEGIELLLRDMNILAMA